MHALAMPDDGEWVGVYLLEWGSLETNERRDGEGRCRTANHGRDGVETTPVVPVGILDIDNVHSHAQCHILVENSADRRSTGETSVRSMTVVDIEDTQKTPHCVQKLPQCNEDIAIQCNDITGSPRQLHVMRVQHVWSSQARCDERKPFDCTARPNHVSQVTDVCIVGADARHSHIAYPCNANTCDPAGSQVDSRLQVGDRPQFCDEGALLIRTERRGPLLCSGYEVRLVSAVQLMRKQQEHSIVLAMVLAHELVPTLDGMLPTSVRHMEKVLCNFDGRQSHMPNVDERTQGEYVETSLLLHPHHHFIRYPTLVGRLTLSFAMMGWPSYRYERLEYFRYEFMTTYAECQSSYVISEGSISLQRGERKPLDFLMRGLSRIKVIEGCQIRALPLPGVSSSLHSSYLRGGGITADEEVDMEALGYGSNDPVFQGSQAIPEADGDREPGATSKEVDDETMGAATAAAVVLVL